MAPDGKLPPGARVSHYDACRHKMYQESLLSLIVTVDWIRVAQDTGLLWTVLNMVTNILVRSREV
jgi:hypothetical protein